jgi:tRNA modification GTPase
MILPHNDTIAGIATAPGEAGIGIIRISGEQALSIGSSIFKAKNGNNFSNLKNQYLYLGMIQDGDREVDEVLLCIMRKPRSFTTEDVVEIHCHGGSYITRKILQLTLANGARLSGPGEFTQRAFLNGRIDLTQAEATNDLIHTRTALGLEMVINQLKGKLYQRIVELKRAISWILALVNAGIDFPEEDVLFSHQKEIFEKIEQVEQQLRSLILSAKTGIIVREGYKVALVGKPNVGKSSIMNLLLEASRAIVTQVPGTTRDTIEESLVINGIPVSIIDTAGIRKTDDQVEKKGVSRSFQVMEQADLILWVIDISSSDFELTLPEQVEALNIPILIIANKIDLLQQTVPDLPEKMDQLEIIHISAKEPQYLNPLKNKIFTFISGDRGRVVEDTMLTNLRQQRAAETALATLLRTKDSLQNALGEELISIDLAQILYALGDIIGETTPDEMLKMIFSQFCIGK